MSDKRRGREREKPKPNVVVDDLGEVENLSIFEKYPFFVYRIAGFFGIVGLLTAVVFWFLNREVAVTCTGTPVLVEERCQGDLFCVQELVAPDDCVEIWLRPASDIPVTVAIRPLPTNLEGLSDIVSLRLSSPEAQRALIFRLPDDASAQNDENWSLSLDIMPQYGVTEPAFDLFDVTYLMPLEPSRGYRVLQASDRPDDHAGWLDHAVDIAARAGLEVVAMREGIVVGMRMDQDAGGQRDDWREQENYMWILHDDGSVATYRHLFRDSQMVAVGEPVEIGQPLALSGSSGYTQEPMLHVHVSSVADNRIGFETHPIRFFTRQGETELRSFEVFNPIKP